MDPDTLFLTVILACVSALGLFHFCWQKPRRRIGKLAQAAAKQRLTITTDLAQLPFGAQQKLLFFGRTVSVEPASRRLRMNPYYSSQIASPVFSGRLGKNELLVCDVTTIHAHDVNSTQTVSIFKLPQPIFRFTMTARHVERFTVKLTHFGEYMGQLVRHYQEIELPALSSSYVIRSPELPHVVLSHLGGEIIRFFSQHKGWFLEGSEDLLLAYQRGKRIKPNHLKDFLQDCSHIAALFG